MTDARKAYISDGANWLPFVSGLPDANVFATKDYVDNEIANIDALPLQTGNNGKFLTTNGSIASWATVDLTSAINTASAAAVTYLVDSAPATLDTLNELAAALGDDPNYATTITNALASKLDTSTASTTYLTQTNASTTYATKVEMQTFSKEIFSIKQENYLANINDVVFINTASGQYTITLPLNPILGQKVKVIDLSNNASINNITINRNGSRIDGLLENFIIDINNASVEFIYTNTTYGWRTING